MANGTPTWNGTDSCGSKTSIGNLGPNNSQAWNQFLTHISSNQNTNVSTLKWYITGGNYLIVPGDPNVANSIACPVLSNLPNFYQYYTRFFIANAGLGWFYTWTELLDTVNNANIITTTLTPTMAWEEVQDILFNEGDTDWHIVPQSDNCSCVGSISGGNGVSGCMNPTATNYNPLATIDDGSCIGGLTPGCCDPTATNYDPLATCNDGSCEYNGGGGCLTCGTGGDDSVPGCCDPIANNYDPLATCNPLGVYGVECSYFCDSWGSTDRHLFERCSDGIIVMFGDWDHPPTHLRFSCEASFEHFDWITNNINGGIPLNIGDVLSLDVHQVIGALGQIAHNQDWAINGEPCFKYLGIGPNPGVSLHKLLYRRSNPSISNWVVHSGATACGDCSLTM